ncbi:hypothetical protein ACFQ4O_11270 [Methylopila musalis]|uniref:RNA-binding protein n=1 Tax=Methylopila musalis TaxID=1134781 RepID=A0ABW3Z8J2_9HYPH
MGYGGPGWGSPGAYRDRGGDRPRFEGGGGRIERGDRGGGGDRGGDRGGGGRDRDR